MSLKRLAAIFAFFLCLAVTACKGTDRQRLELRDNWAYSLSNPALCGDNFTAMDYFQLDNLAKLIPGGTGTVWVRTRFSLPDGFDRTEPAVWLGQITMADRTYLNGMLIGSAGRFGPENEFSAWNLSRAYSMPSCLLRDGVNELVVEIWVDGEGSLVSVPFVGNAKDAFSLAARDNFWNSKIHLLFAFFMLIIAWYHFMIYVKRPEERENLIFALINVVSVLYLSVFYINDIPGMPTDWFPFLWFQKIVSNGLTFVLPFLLTSFVNSFLKRRRNWIVTVIRLVFVIVPFTIVMFVPDYPTLHSVRDSLQLFLVPPMLYILFIMIVSIRRKNSEIVPLLIGFSPMVLTVLADLLLHTVLKLYNVVYLSSFGWQLAVITLLFIMANRFANSRREAEYLNAHLEKKVADRTRELSETNEKLSEFNNQLEEAKRQSDRDMTLAVYVQKSFYPHSAPVVKGWDIAYTFRPKSGVSGDLYDFFCRDDVFLGAGLFDVSGHGIASGLVTMLGKAVIDRSFRECYELPLSVTMKKINDTLVAEKGDIENYMTGILLRVKNGKVEFINAGHPKAFCRLAKTGKSVPLEIPVEEGKEACANSIIGIGGLDPEYKAIKFSMNVGDAVILYTDCLSESRNAAGEEFGTERIGEAFAECGALDAHGKLDYVLGRFAQFTSGVEVKDDLTVIVLQRKAEL